MGSVEVVIDRVEGKLGRAEFVDLGRSFAEREPHWVPQLRSEQLEQIGRASCRERVCIYV